MGVLINSKRLTNANVATLTPGTETRDFNKGELPT